MSDCIESREAGRFNYLLSSLSHSSSGSCHIALLAWELYILGAIVPAWYAAVDSDFKLFRFVIQTNGQLILISESLSKLLLAV